tara:strand:+ start:462 stop:845 length:384 start_codon:yes stop_codon:yes gene_type:complete
MLELCLLSDLKNGEAKGFNVEGSGIAQRLIIVRQGDGVKAYINLCPHIGSRLDGDVGQFLDDEDPTMLLCDSHAALFRIEDGVCVEGPCEGDKLFPADVTVVGNAVVYVRDGVELVDEISRIVSTTD